MEVNEQQKKYMSGKGANKALANMLDELKTTVGCNISVQKSYAVGYPHMDKQFKMDYCITFNDFGGVQWLLKVTSTIRDRINGTEFFAQHIRVLDEKDNKVEKVYVVFPDSTSEKEYANAKRYSKKISSKRIKSFLTDVVTINELRDLIIDKCMLDTSDGARHNIVGKDAEKRVLQLLSDEKNWKLWNNYEQCKHELKSDTFQWFKIIMSGIEAESSIGYVESKNPITKIEATDDIPNLDGGGYPKTDVSFSATFSDRSKQVCNISIKRTDKRLVSVHEGNVADLISALRLDVNSELSAALYAFQKYGSLKQLSECADSKFVDVLNGDLHNYNKELVEFALFGVNSPRITHPIQEANCILFINSNLDKKSFWLRDDYVEYYLENYGSKGQFGTPFQWTYPSKKRGKSFQLKGFTNN